MNAVAEPHAAVSVALLGPTDPAREQLRQALLGLGADLVFEGELREGPRIVEAGRPPAVLIVNLEPGVEDDLDAIQDLLDNPATSVVFNEGEVSSQLTGWDLARWARHLAAKVLGVPNTLPPLPSGAERLPVLELLPEPGRPQSPAQQQDHLRFDDYAEEATGLADGVPVSPRLDLAEPPAAPAPRPVPVAEPPVAVDAGPALDFDFSPVPPSTEAEALEPATESEPDTLENMDLTTLFDQGLDQLSPDDLLAKLQAAMGLEPVPLSEEEPQDPPAPGEAASSMATTEVLTDQIQAQDFNVEPDAADADEAMSTSFDFVSAGSAVQARDPEPASELDFDPGFDWQVPASASAANSTPNAELDEQEAAATLESVARELSAVDVQGFSFDPVEAERAEQGEAAPARVDTANADDTSLDFDFSAATDTEFDFQNFAADSGPQSAQDAPIDLRGFDSEDAALGGTLTLASSDADDEQIARLAAALDAQPSLPSAQDLPPLEFDFARPVEAPAEVPSPAQTARPAASAAQAPAAPTAPPARPQSGEPGRKPSFGELSLQPIEDGFIDTSVKAPEAPARTFDFSSLSLSLEPIEDASSQASPSPSSEEDINVTTMRDGAWLRDIGEGPEPAPTASPSAEVEAPQPEQAFSEGAAPDFNASGYDFNPAAVAPARAQHRAAPLQQGISRVIVLCASIGGPDALRSFLGSIPAGFPALFVVVQHLENGFFERLAQQLQKTSTLPVRVPLPGLPARDGEVLVVSSGQRLLLSVDGQVELPEIQAPSRYRPCIDDVLRDVADTFGANGHAIIFSGMAADAVEGAVYLTERGGEVWAQDPETCVVSSMVDGARARGVVEYIGSPRELAEHCVREFGAT